MYLTNMDQNIFLLGTILLATSLVFVLLFRRYGLGAVLGYIVAGIAVGPSGLQLVSDAHVIMRFSEIGIVLLLFLVGLDLAPRRLWRLKREILGLGLAQVVLAGLALAAGLLLFTSFTPAAALALGLPLALSSTAQVLPMLQSEGRLNSPLGERAFSILLFQDLSIVPLLTIVAALSRAPNLDVPVNPLVVVTQSLLAIIVLVAAGRFLLVPALRLIGHYAERELFIVAGLLAVCASAGLTSAIGLSPALGAFIAGVMLADSPFRHELEADINPFRSILLGLFFLSVGMLLDIHAVLERPFFVLAMAAMVICIKAAVLFGIARLFGAPQRGALILALLLSQGGEFAFVIFGAAQMALLIAPETVSIFNAVVTVSMVATPFLMLLAKKMGDITTLEPSPAIGQFPTKSAEIIVVGHGRFGQTIAQIAAAAGFKIILIDIDPAQIEMSSSFGHKVFYGDGTRIDLLRSAGAEQARLLFFCQNGDGLDQNQIAQIATSFPHLSIFARVYDRVQLMQLAGAQLAGTEREVMESAIALARKGLFNLDMTASEVDDIVQSFRRHDRKRLSAQITAQDVYAGDGADIEVIK